MRNLKRVFAIVLTVAMMFTLVSFSAAAADTFEMSYKIRKTADGTDYITETKAGKTVYVDCFVTSGTYVFATFEWKSALGALSADNTTINYATAGGFNAGNIYLNYLSGITVTDDTPIATVELTIPDDVDPTDAYKLIEGKTYAYTAGTAMGNGTLADASIKVLDGFAATQAEVAETTVAAGLGDTLEDVIANLPTTATVKNEDGTKSEAGWAVTDWACADYDADVATDYTFTGKVMPEADRIAEVPEAGLEVSVTVTVGKIDLAADMVEALEDVSVKAVKEDAEVTSMTAAEALAAVTDQLVAEVAIANNEKYPETAAIAWAVKDEAATLNLTKVTAEEGNEANVVTLVGTVTPDAEGNYTGTAAVEINVVVAPAVVTGGSVKLPNANQNGKPKVTITFPTETTGEGEDAVTTVVDIEVGQEITADIVDGDGEVVGTVAVTVTEEDIEAGGLTLQFADTLKEMGFTSGDEYTVIVKVDGAEFLNGDALEGEGTTNDVKYSGGSSVSGIGNTATTTKEYAVKVADAVNGTVAVSKTAAVNGTVITITATPAEGYKVDTVAVTDKNGINIPVDATAMTFTMPAKEVTVKVTFVEGEAEVVTPPATEGLTDIEGHWAADAINALVEAGIVNGNADGTFAPDNAITRAEFTKMIVNLFGVKATSTETGFVDCAADAWFTPYVAAAKEAGYVTGVSETEFAPDALVTREQACAILGRALNASTDAAVTFTDAAEIEEYAIGYVAALAELGLVNGYEDGTFAPAKNITRAEAAKIIAGALELVSKIEEAATEEAATEEAVVEEATEEVVAEEAAEEVVEEVVEDEVPEEVVDEK